MYSSIYLSECGAGFLIHFRILSASLLPESNAPCTVPDEDNKDGPYININCEIEKSIGVFGEGQIPPSMHGGVIVTSPRIIFIICNEHFSYLLNK